MIWLEQDGGGGGKISLAQLCTIAIDRDVMSHRIRAGVKASEMDIGFLLDQTLVGQNTIVTLQVSRKYIGKLTWVTRIHW